MDLIELTKKQDSMNMLGDGNSRKIQFVSEPSSKALTQLLLSLKTSGVDFSFYDCLYPSPTDSGAYISYSPTRTEPNRWRMTLGNHGWSGGIYIIEKTILLAQLKNLIHSNNLSEIKIGKVGFFAHYTQESPSRNKRINEMLGKLHKRI